MEPQTHTSNKPTIDEIHKQNQENERKWELNGWKEVKAKVDNIGEYKDFTAGILGVKEKPDPEKMDEHEEQGK